MVRVQYASAHSEINCMSTSRSPVRQEMDRLDAPKEWQQVAICELGEIAAAIGRVAAAMRTGQFPEADLFAIRLVMEEAIVNAIKHGNKQNPAKKVEVRYCLDEHSVVVEVEDEGAGFDPSQVPDPLDPANLERSCGHGVLLMRHYTSWLFYNEEGNCVTFGRRRSSTCHLNGHDPGK
jgi:serine/threonine-protein kinase RsbW